MKKDILIAFLLAVISGMILSIGVNSKYSKYDLNKDGAVDEKDLEIIQDYCGRE